MRGLQSVRTSLTLVVAVVVALEVLHWARPLTVEHRAGSVPTPTVAPDGAIWFRKLEFRPGDKPDSQRTFAMDFDTDGRFLRETEITHGDPASEGAVHPSVYERWRRTTPGERLHDLMDNRFRERQADSEPDWSRWLWFTMAQELTSSHASVESRREYGRTRRWVSGGPQWTFRDGRFVCTGSNGALLGSFGPDGFVSGESAADAARFSPSTLTAGGGAVMRDGADTVDVLVDPDRREVVFVRFPSRQNRFFAQEAEPPPFVVNVTAVPVAGPRGEAPTPLWTARAGYRPTGSWWNLRDGSGEDSMFGGPRLAYVRAGAEIVGVRDDGRLYRASIDADERDATLWDRRFTESGGIDKCEFTGEVLVALRPPLDPARPSLRVRQWRQDGALLVDDVRAPLLGTSAVLADVVGRAPSFVRPPVLTAASFVLPGPEDFEDYSDRWLLDPDVAGGANVAWLLASLAVAALCGAFARRRARVHSPTAESVLFWTVAGAALGVVGIVWMEIVCRRSHVAACACGRRRAVHVAACPSCAADWPAPAPTGVEVFA